MAAETLREFLVELGFHTDEASFKKFLSGVEAVIAPVLKLGAATVSAATAVEVMVERVSHQMSDLYYAAQRSNTTVGAIQAIGFAAKQVGLSAATGEEMLGGLARAMRENPGAGALIERFAGPGGLDRVNGQLGVTQKGLFNILEGFKRLSDHGEFFVANQYASMMGLPTGDTLYQALANLSDIERATRQSREAMRNAGLDSGEGAAKFRKFAQDVGLLDQNLRASAIVIAQSWLPAADAMVKKLTELDLWFNRVNAERGGVPGEIGSGAGILAGSGLGGWLLKKLGFNATGKLVGAPAAAAGWLGSRLLGPLGMLLGMTSPAGEGEQAQINAERAAPVIRFFMQHGWSKGQATGIAANLLAESGMNPNQAGDHGQAYGVAQWHPDRQAAFAKWAGHDIHSSTLAEQLGFINYELRHGLETNAGALLSHAQTAKAAAESFSRNYERPAGDALTAAARGQMAINLAQNTNITVNGSSDPAGTAKKIGAAQSRVNGDIVRNLASVVK